MRTLLATFAFLTLSMTSTVALADSAPDKPNNAGSGTSEADSARKLFETGTELLNSGRYAEAAEKLQEAWKIKQSYDVAGNLGTALFQLGKHAEAARFLAYALDAFPAGGSPKEKKWVEELLQSVRKEVVLVRVSVSVDDAEVLLNGEVIGTSPLKTPTYAPPGKIVLDVKKAGFESAHVELKGEKGSEASTTLTLKAKADTPPVTERPQWPAFVIGGVGVVSLAVGGALLGVGVGKKGEADDIVPRDSQGKPLCSRFGGASDLPGGEGCDDVRALASSGKTFANAGLGLMIGGGVLMVAGVAYWLWPSGSAPSKSGTTRALPFVSRDSGGVVLYGSF